MFEDDRRYFETVGRSARTAPRLTNCCNCCASLHAFETLEPPADVSCAVPC